MAVGDEEAGSDRVDEQAAERRRAEHEADDGPNEQPLQRTRNL
jgi:hypothetical protein